ncbi:MAG: hypothetical protein IJV22_10250, partial [Bacteroidales bacterium]|nr:hypothetical protein [Bacteroidales bacterium]
MKKRLLLQVLFFVFCSFGLQAQIVTAYQQGFEATGETSSYQFQQGAGTLDQTYASSGSRSIKLPHTNNKVVMMLDTIDLTQNPDWSYAVLEFSHMCYVDALATSRPAEVGLVEIRRVDENDNAWVKMAGAPIYDTTTGSFSIDYNQNTSFSSRSYDVWQSGTRNNSYWRAERFQLQRHMAGVERERRKYLIRFTLNPMVRTSDITDPAWYIDNIRVRVSSGMMYSPNMITLSIPELELYPNSQPTRLEVKASMPSVAAGQSIDPDSAYILYKVGYSNTVFRSPMSLVGGTTDRYRGYIPFFGYDTNVYYRIVVKDRSVNHNTSTYPSDESAWGRYHNIRGYANTTTYDYTASMSTDMPFCANGDSKFQFLYPQSAMQGMGFQPGAITQLKFLTASAVAASTRERVQIRMVNVPAGYEVNTETFYSGFSKIVYDSVLTLTQNNLTVGTIDLQDTFFYAGQDVLVIFSSTNNFTRNNVALRVRSVSTTVSGQSLSTSYSSSDRSSPFTSGNTMFSSGNFVASRPDFGFTAFANLPLRFDAGVLSILAPNDSTPGTALSANNIRVTIKNFGSTPLSSFKVWYQIDDSAAHSYNWTGNLAANATQDITISTTQWLTSGTHTIRAWVDDTLTGGGITYRDHEPLNDTAYSSFVSCNGAMNGIRQIGGTGADFATLDDFFFMLKQCGVNGVLTVKVAPGTYNNTINVPHVPGASPTNYIQFEPLGAAGSVVVRGMLNLQQASHVRVKDFVFEATNTTTCVSMGTRSSDCHFLNCRFSAPTSGVAYTLIYSGGADSLHVKDCEFLRGGLAISLIGSAADNKARGSRIEGSTFTDQLNNAIVVRNQIASVVDSNTIRNIISNSSYAVLLQDCDGAMRVTRNVMYVTSGASCIGVTGLNGTSSAYAVVANNMLVSNDEGTSNMLTTALNVINASYTKVVYNSVKLVAPTRGGIAAATLGGSGVNQCYFYNNIVSSFDTVNYAFNYIPQAGSTNFIGNNIYYSQSRILNRHDGVNCLNLSTWQTRLGDAQSQAINPSFIGASATDLRSYSANVKGHAQPVAEVTNDMFGTTRDASAPCVGAFEFLPLANDFAIEALAEPYDEYCAVPASAPLRVVIKNSGVNPFVPSATNTLRLYYSRGNRMGVLTPGQSGSVLVDRTIPGGDTIIFTTGSNVSFPVNGMNDTTYTFSLWLSSTTDPNISNDSSQFTVTARYQYPALTPITRTIDYGTRTTFNITAGLQSWDYALFNSGRIHKSLTYWYSDSLSNQPIFIGNDYTTAPLYQDTTFYIRQYRNMPIVVISEVQVIRTGAGVTSPQPLWMSSSTGLAVKLSNFGDVPAHIKGDRLLFVSNDDNLNNRTYEFPNVVIQPGESMVLQCRTNIGVVDSAHTLGFRDMSATTSTKLGIAYYDDTLGLMDVLPLNGITSETRWNNLVGSVPLTIWNGPAISLASTSAGVSRLRWPTSASTQSATCWQVADESHPMSMGTTNASMQRFTYNGCESAMSTVRINIRALPQVDMAVDSVEVPEGCGLGMEPIVVRMSNYGSASSDTTIWHYSVNGVVRCTDTLPPLAAGSSRVHTFSRQADLSSTALETQYSVRVWLDHNSSDASTLNDSSLSVITSRYTPGLANVKTYDTVQYASKDTLQAIGLLTDSLIWYDRQMRLLDTTNVYLTDFLYAQDTFYVSQVAAYDDIAQVGSLSTVMAANRYPSPYNTINNYGKEQYIYLGSEIAASGYSAGYIGAVSFYLESLTESSVTYDSIVISMAPTSLANFNSSTAWVRDLSRVYSRSNYTISQSSRGGWIRHGLDRPFYWDGIANVVVQVTRYISSARNSGLSIRSTTTGASRVIYSDNNSNANIASYVGSASRDQNVPDIRFAFTQYGCEGPKRPIYVNVQGAPDVDASLEWVWGSASASSCGPTQLTIDVRNGGRTPISNYTVDYWIDTAHARYTGTTTIAPGATGRVVVGTPTFTPGLHNLKAVVNAAGDTIKVNDTIVTDLAVSFCAGIYTIGPADSNDYHSFTEAVNTLNAVGVDGAVEFHVQRGVYNEQLTFSNIPGSSYSSPVTFRASENDSSAVVIRHSPTESANYVVNIENADNLNFKYLTFYAKGTGNYSTVVSLKNANNIHFTNSQIRVRGGLNTVSAVGFLVNDYVNYLYIDSCVIDSGFNAIRSPMTYGRGVMGLNVRHSKLLNFTSRGLFLTNASDAVITWNKIYSGVNINNRSLWGMYIADHTGGVDVEYNDINLFDERNGSKRGIVLSRCAANNSVRNKIYSNLISLHGTGNYDGDPSGIWIDSSTSHVNVYFNTVRLYAGTTSTASKSFLVRNASSNLYILNNLFDNLSQGYCYYVESPAAISLSDFNVYHTAMDTVLRHFVYWGRDYDNLDSMRVASGQDANSYNDDPYYVSDRDAHMAFGTYCELAQYNTEVPYDIDGEIRPQIPMPSIGADEVNRRLHDISIMEIFEPNADMDYIEDDVHRVVVKLYNNGSSTESNLSWTAEIAGSSPLTITTPRQIASLAPGRSIIDTAYLTLPIGIIDTQKVVVKFMPMDNDLFVDDNVDTVEYFIDPSYNMRADAVSAVLGDGCRLYETPLTIRLTNVGRKDIPTSVPFTIGFEATSASPDVIVSQFPLIRTEQITLPVPLAVNASIDIPFTTMANLYPTGNDRDVAVRLRAWQTHPYDQKPITDTTPYINVTSKYTPHAPIGQDLRLPYASWDTLWATQTDLPTPTTVVNRPIRWHRDSTEAPYFESANYLRSTWWETPQYFHDSVYYLSCISTSGCTSYYNPVHVTVVPSAGVDLAIQRVVTPFDKVYMDNDTVRVNIINYGRQAASNFAVVYQLRDVGGQTDLQLVRETYTGTIGPGEDRYFTPIYPTSRHGVPLA